MHLLAAFTEIKLPLFPSVSPLSLCLSLFMRTFAQDRWDRENAGLERKSRRNWLVN